MNQILFILLFALSGISWAGQNVADSSARIRIFTFNILRTNGLAENEMKSLARYFKERPDKTPDFILLQEVYSYNSKDPARAHAAAILAREMNYHVKYANKGGIIGPSEGSAILSRFPFEHFDSISMGSAPLLDSLRLAVMGEFMVPGIGRVRVVNVHLAYAPDMKKFRRSQVKQTLQWMCKRESNAETSAAVSFLGGDFNASADSGELAAIFNSAYCGFFNFQNFNTKDFTCGSKERHDKYRIDQIFVSGGPLKVQFLGETLPGKEGTESYNEEIKFSDHVPVYHEYLFHK